MSPLEVLKAFSSALLTVCPLSAFHYKPLSSNCNYFSSKHDYFLLFQIATL
nr:MAG TPA: hypothetical protein [Caudoviricetes sp.]